MISCNAVIKGYPPQPRKIAAYAASCTMHITLNAHYAQLEYKASASNYFCVISITSGPVTQRRARTTDKQHGSYVSHPP